MPYFGLYDWLSEPTNGPNECCQCFSLKCKKITLLLILFPFTILLGIIVLLLWTRLGFELPVAIIAVVVILQFLFFLISVPAFFNERKYKLLFPLVVIHVIALIVYVIVAIIYIIKFIIAKSSGHGDVRNSSHSIFLPGIPSRGLGDTGVEGMTDAERTLHTLGHVLFLIPIQLFLTYICYGVYVIFRSRSCFTEKSPKAYYVNPQGRGRQPRHNIVVLEQWADDALYGSRAEKGKNGIP
ncbi:hypothetical protein FO519_007240 [Halicephalobus sp. NKZ332]|nr:hypothetical protein FO519_007240 [Halicephalobus sp. NKZ332]